MTAHADRVLLELRLRKAASAPLRWLVFRHDQSGAERRVEYLGMAGEPLRAQIHWPIAGDYLVSPRSGTILGTGQSADKLRHWKISEADHAFLKQEYRLARARVPLRPKRIEELAKCR